MDIALVLTLSVELSGNTGCSRQMRFKPQASHAAELKSLVSRRKSCIKNNYVEVKFVWQISPPPLEWCKPG